MDNQNLQYAFCCEGKSLPLSAYIFYLEGLQIKLVKDRQQEKIYMFLMWVYRSSQKNVAEKSG